MLAKTLPFAGMLVLLKNPGVRRTPSIIKLVTVVATPAFSESPTVYGHSGNTLGYTQYAFSTPDGSRSATVSINVQVTQKSEGQQARVFRGLLRVAQSAICQALR